MSRLGPSDVLRPYPAADDDRDEQERTDNDGCCSRGKGRPLDVNEGEPSRGLVYHVFSILGLLVMHSLHPLKFPQLCSIALAVGARTCDDNHFSSSFSCSLFDRLGNSEGEDTEGEDSSPSCCFP